MNLPSLKSDAAVDPGPTASEAVVRATRDAVITLDADGCVLNLNPAATLTLGRFAGASLGRPFESLFSGCQTEALRGAVHRFVNEGASYSGPGQVALRGAAGAQGTFELTPVRYVRDGAWCGALILRDNAAEVAFTQLLEHEATHDPLTGLPNRGYLKEALTQALARAADNARDVAVLFVGLDRFRTLNDARGHEVGDVVLTETARRLRRLVQARDVVVRAGGDEFVIVTDGEHGSDCAWVLAQEILTALARPYRLSGASELLSACVGMVVAERGQSTPARVLQRGDAALHRAKAEGPGHFEVFHQGWRDNARAQHELEVAVRAAHMAQALHLNFQPLVGVNPARWVGFEALLRWTDGQGQSISPAAFVPALERTGQIVPVGAWVLEQACLQLQKWRALEGQQDLHMAVNLSVRQLEEPDIVDIVQSTLERTGVPPANLVIEVTESALALDLRGTIERLVQLKALGVSISIDDFGTGYSSLAYLHRMPVDVLKIDQAFVKRLDAPDADSSVVEAITSLAKAIGLSLVAEGVETEAQVKILKSLGVDVLQGYYFSRPRPADEVEAVLRQKPAL